MKNYKDKEGIYTGTNINTNIPIEVIPFTKSGENTNMFVMGKIGKGRGHKIKGGKSK